MSERLDFLLAFVRDWTRIGSITPSSTFLARALARQIEFDTAKVVIEFGAGTGVITRELLAGLHSDARLLTFEIEVSFLDRLRAELADPRVEILSDSAETIVEQLAARGLGRADVIVSGLPFTSLPKDLGRRILRESYRALRPGGQFVAYQYSPFILGPLLYAAFGDVDHGFCLRNIPPAFTFAVRKSFEGDR
ncbi:MAG: methyltransferase domain-containing protein [Chloroflexi bacterium]|nr:methyltransferase domain-containing protein [Chloroflexota bacterium]